MNDGPRGVGILLRIALSFGEDAIDDYEWIEPQKGYREWLIPADSVNQHIQELEIVP
jgi:hypothetical protein